LSGRKAVDDFIAISVSTGTPAEWYEQVDVAGPLASFQGADTWVEHPYREGVALIGDAAASSDPSFGCGLSLTLRDVRVLRDQLLSTDDWDRAAHTYAAEHDRYFGAVHRHLDWMTKLYFEPGPEAAMRRQHALPRIAEGSVPTASAPAQRRQHALPRIAEDPSRAPDIVGIGPEAPSDEHARQRCFGED
jgi:2-polyprenyl-6-methoxyphenol hydroxylase-like FAD-dependent oxidoreductase